MEQVSQKSKCNFNQDQQNDGDLKAGGVLVVKLAGKDLEEFVDDIEPFIEDFAPFCDI